MRILIALSYYAPYVSGVSEYARMLAEGMASRGHRVQVLTGRHDDALAHAETIAGVQVERVPVWIRLHKGYISPALPIRFGSLARTADVINLHAPMLEAGLLAILPSVARKLVVTYQCDLAYAGGVIDRLAVMGVRASAGIAIAKSRRVVVLAEDYARASAVLRGAAARVVEVIPPIKNLDRPLIESERGLKSGPAIGFLGRFVEEKGIDVLLDAAPAILKGFPNATFKLAGAAEGIAGGSVLPRLQAKIEALGSRVLLLGRLTDEALPSFYSSLDVFVLPSINAYEAFGMVQAEAMAQGTPVVASDLPGVRRTVQLTGIGALACPGDARDLAAAVIRVLQERRARHEVRQRALAVFSNDRFLDDYERLFAQHV